MTTEQTPPPPPGTWGAPVPVAERPRNPWSTRKIVISAAIAVVIVAGGTAAVIAATNNASSTTTGNGGPGGGAGFGQGGPGFGRDGIGGPGLQNALHGDFVASNGNGGYTTERLQNGTVSAVSATDITVKSTDGYTQTYVIGSNTTVDRGQDTIGKVATGNTVTVIATLSGQTATASTIEDSSIDSRQFNSGQGGGGFEGPPGNGN